MVVCSACVDSWIFFLTCIFVARDKIGGQEQGNTVPGRTVRVLTGTGAE